jgi:XTP/dITP diphosphohydrolase
MNVVLATSNAGKLAELNVLLLPLGITLQAQSATGVAGADETGATFVENALIKARHAATETDLPAIADDSGLVVGALGGAPGIRSARYAGVGAGAIANNRALIEALRGIEDRRAYFYCALVYLRDPNDPAPLIATAQWNGWIVDDARGAHGFGYDPHFRVDGMTETAAELAPELKNRISHRGRAAAALVASMHEAFASRSTP